MMVFPLQSFSREDWPLFEFETTTRRLSVSSIPSEISAAFQQDFSSYPYRSLHLWEEHCTECAFPACYKTCDLFEPRKDGNCRRFVGGVVPIDGVTSGGSPVVEVTFKRWANMFARGPATLVAQADIAKLEAGSRWWSETLARVPDGGIRVNGWPGPFVRVARRLRARRIRQTLTDPPAAPSPDGFVITLYIPDDIPFDATLAMSNDDGQGALPYQRRLFLEKGFHSIKIPMAEIVAVIGNAPVDFVSLIPNTEGMSSNRIYLGFMGFFSQGRPAGIDRKAANKTVKVLVWDLDHTIWNGILVEDGLERLTLRPGVADILRTLDQRGIVNSVASKNDPDLALSALKHFGIDSYFVFPQIGWAPKSNGLKQIVADFNVGADTVAFIDDQHFERSEVEAVLSEVRTYDAADYASLPDRPEFRPELSSESASRRQHYINEGARRALSVAFKNEDYDAFLRDCNLQMTILSGGGQDIDRIYELTQRTNQMNFSGTRHSRDELVGILADPSYEAYSIRCEDKFGHYGTVGFALVARPRRPDDCPRVVELAFSCRVQSKRAEHAFLAWLGQTSRDRGMTALEVQYVPNARNKAVAAVFGDMGFEKVPGGADGQLVMRIAVRGLDVADYPWSVTVEAHVVAALKETG